MYYDSLSNNTVKITLTSKDMENYRIRSESLRSRSAESKRNLTCFLKKFQSESSLFPDHKAERLFLEAFPSDDGGCVMYVSTLGSDLTAPGPVKKTQTVMFTTRSLDDAAKLCLCIKGKVRSSSLYRLGDFYCLIFGLSPDLSVTVEHLIEEYGSLSDDSTDIAYTREHGETICRANAVKILSGLA